MNAVPAWVDSAIAVVALTIAFALARKLRAARARLSERESLWRRLISVIEPGTSFDQSAGRLLHLVASFVEAPGYYLYLVDSGCPTRLVLKAMRSESETARFGVEYSSFAGDSTAYEAPLILGGGGRSHEVGFEEISSHTVLVIPIRGRDGSIAGVIHVGPVDRRDVPSRLVARLREIQPAIAAIVCIMCESDIIRSESNDLTGRLQAMSIAAKGAFEPARLAETMVSLGSRLAGSESWLMTAFGGLGPGRFKPMWLGIPDVAAREAIRNLSEGFEKIGLPSEVEVIDLRSGCGGALAPLLPYSTIPQALWVPLRAERHIAGGLVYLLDDSSFPETHKRNALAALATRLAEMLENMHAQAETNRSYVDTLRALVHFMDGQDIHSMGHSERVARFAREIADNLDLDPGYVEAVEIAAYLHDVGMCALKSEIVHSKASFTAHQYEEMKVHASIGGALLAPINDPAPLAPMIRHHHERYDGWGYPDSLKGEEIPIGARIIAVADVFNAKISSRGYRRAQDFGEALKDIEKAKGTMLDPRCVDALLSAISNREKAPERMGKTLEPCWEMIQCPEPVRQTCPAGQSDCNCWDMKGVRCDLHGDDCEHCLVFTEYKYRALMSAGVAGDE